MHRCTSSNSSSSSSNYSSFSMFFSGQYYPFSADVDSYPNTSSSSSSYSSSSVDCTLSLATPSTRQSENAPVKSKRWSGSSFVSNLCSWSALNSKKKVASSGPTRNSSSSSNGGNGSVMINTVNGDPLLARRCANCDTTSTPLWRNGPRGPKSLCNACGIRYKKEERRATAAATAVAAAPAIIEAQQFMGNHHHQSWNYRAHERVVPSEFRFIEEGDDNNNIIERPERTDHTATVPYFSWHLNIPERHGLVHDYS